MRARYGSATPRRKLPLVMAMIVAVGFVSLRRGDSSASILPGTSSGRGSWAFDVEDDRLLVGFADNVFFGQVQATWPAPGGICWDWTRG